MLFFCKRALELLLSTKWKKRIEYKSNVMKNHTLDLASLPKLEGQYFMYETAMGNISIQSFRMRLALCNMWHDQGKWVTCRKFKFLFSYTPLQLDIRLQSYEGFDNAKNNKKQKNLNTVFANISKTTSHNPTHSSWSCHICDAIKQNESELE